MSGMPTYKSFKHPIPMKLLTLGLAFGLLLIPVLGSVVWSMYEVISNLGTHELNLQRLAGNVAHLNEALTMHARLAASTGDPKWERDYNAIQPQLDNALLRIAIESREEYEKNYASQTKMAYTKLLEMESVALALARQGKLKKAYDILISPEYETQKGLYSEGIRQMIDAVQTRINGKIDAFRSRLWFIGVMEVTTLSIIIIAWIGSSLLLKRHLTMRRIAENALAQEKERLSVTLRSIDQGVISTDLSGMVNLMNPVAEELTGWCEDRALGRNIKDVFVLENQTTGESPENLMTTLCESCPVDARREYNTLVSGTGGKRLISYSATPIKHKDGKIAGLAIVFRDITEQERMRREASKTEKLESVGILAGGIAHDFNNILTAILGNISLGKLSIDKSHSVYERLDEAEWAARRAKDLAAQLLVFSKGGEPIRKVISLDVLLQQWVGFSLLGSNVRWELDVAEDLWNVEIDEGQISRVIQNLLINADQAMPNGGTVEVKAENYFHKEATPLDIMPGKYVKILVVDEGTGISEANLEKIFDPYFTTKQTGTGMGLASSYAAIKRHGGQILVNSRIGVGTAFSVFLPATEELAATRVPTDLPVSKGSGRVLLMDDSPLIRNLAGELLTCLGYSVSTTQDGRETVNLYRECIESGRPFDAVIMDLTIPGGMGGKEAIERLKELDPEVKAIVSSGYSDDPIMGDFRRFGFSGVLAKPYSAAEMSQILHTVIGREDSKGLVSV